ncbi:uncharacterized protein BO97DRAFT_406648 [Aspergillus homomorphus CBS 101889]|uniref:Uncharacterized protein n=1 Tax=Aspergillus homomorphus (strain CBS 101889) TaxID=1450537 RepID=A0A395HSF5_ASPHC|nr:hypothetical protein BO97DRAFT_406648 [Aspergillus homomorphus CBS 101889]RAL10872.1 hypothetical protein BO97DRAFT_406648 [Aspergillus homomorphus CBS 101889]
MPSSPYLVIVLLSLLLSTIELVWKRRGGVQRTPRTGPYGMLPTCPVFRGAYKIQCCLR